MPQNRNNLGPAPETMTWGKAAPVFVIAGLFDALRFMCQQLWFFGPALAALYCASQVSGAWWNIAGIATTACVAIAGAAGVYGLPALGALGIVLAMAVGLLGWLIIGLVLVMGNPRLFKANAYNTAWFVGSLLVSEIPFVGTLPALTGTLFKLYRTQISTEKAALAAYMKATEEARIRERKEQAERVMQVRAMQMQQQEAANDDLYAQQEAAATAEEEERLQTEAANDESYDNKVPRVA